MYHSFTHSLTLLFSRTNILRCLMSWVTLGLFPLEGIERNRLTSFAFEALSAAEESHNVHEAAADAVCALLERLEEMPEQVRML